MVHNPLFRCANVTESHLYRKLTPTERPPETRSFFLRISSTIAAKSAALNVAPERRRLPPLPPLSSKPPAHYGSEQADVPASNDLFPYELRSE